MPQLGDVGGKGCRQIRPPGKHTFIKPPCGTFLPTWLYPHFCVYRDCLSIYYVYHKHLYTQKSTNSFRI